MAHESTTAPSCLSSFSRRSQSKALAPTASSNVSTLHVRSWGALALGVICAGVTGFVLFEDVLRNGAPITTDHVLTAAVIVITAAAGHMWWRRLWSSAFITGLGLLLIFGSGLVYLVVASGGRNAEVAANKRHAAHASNTERQDRLRKIAEAEYILASCPAAAPKRDYGERCGLRDAMAAECGSGKGKRCDGKSYSVSTYEAAVEGHRAALKGLPEQEEDGALKATARAIVAFQGVTAEEKDKAEQAYVERLEIVLPYIKALLVEVATIVFLGVGIGHRSAQNRSTGTVPLASTTANRTVRRIVPTTVTGGTVPQTATVLRPNFGRTVPRGTVPLTQDEALERLLAAITRGGIVPQDDLPELFHVRAKSTVSRWCKDWEERGVISRTVSGRQKFVMLRDRREQAG